MILMNLKINRPMKLYKMAYKSYNKPTTFFQSQLNRKVPYVLLNNHQGSGVLRQEVNEVDKYSTSSAFLRRLLSGFGAAFLLAERPALLGGRDTSLSLSSSTPASTKLLDPSQESESSDAMVAATDWRLG